MIVIYPFTLTRRQDVKMHGCKKKKKKNCITYVGHFNMFFQGADCLVVSLEENIFLSQMKSHLFGHLCFIFFSLKKKYNLKIADNVSK